MVRWLATNPGRCWRSLWRGRAVSSPCLGAESDHRWYERSSSWRPTSFGFLFSSSFIISWRLLTLQYCSGFCHTLTWISHGFTCVPHPDPPSRLPPPHPSGSSQCTSPEHLSHAFFTATIQSGVAPVWDTNPLRKRLCLLQAVWMNTNYTY